MLNATRQCLILHYLLNRLQLDWFQTLFLPFNKALNFIRNFVGVSLKTIFKLLRNMKAV